MSSQHLAMYTVDRWGKFSIGDYFIFKSNIIVCGRINRIDIAIDYLGKSVADVYYYEMIFESPKSHESPYRFYADSIMYEKSKIFKTKDEVMVELL